MEQSAVVVVGAGVEGTGVAGEVWDCADGLTGRLFRFSRLIGHYSGRRGAEA